MTQEKVEAENVFATDVSEEQLIQILQATEALKVIREGVSKVKAIKVQPVEEERIESFAEYLHALGYIPEATFAALFIYCFNLAYTLHREAAEREARKEKRNG